MNWLGEQVVANMASSCYALVMTDRETVQSTFLRMDPAEAATALAQAERKQEAANQAVRAESGWTGWFLATFGATSLIFFALCGVGGVAAYVASWLAYGVISRWFARRARVSWRGFDRLSGVCFATWFVLQGAVCAVGFNIFRDQVAYWVPAAFVVSAPFFVGAWLARQRS